MKTIYNHIHKCHDVDLDIGWDEIELDGMERDGAQDFTGKDRIWCHDTYKD